MKGFMYRRAMNMKDLGERLGHIQMFGIRIFGWASAHLIKNGLELREKVLNSL